MHRGAAGMVEGARAGVGALDGLEGGPVEVPGVEVVVEDALMMEL